MTKHWQFAFLLCLLWLVPGCGGKRAVERPDLDPQEAARQALELFDTNRDGAIAGNELDAAPFLQRAAASKADRRLSVDDLAARFDSYFNSSIVMTGVSCLVTLDGRPLEGATVTFAPAEFLESVIEPATAVTNTEGTARPVQSGKPALYLGAYSVRISKLQDGEETIPAKYNANTTLGAEIVLEGRDIVTEFTFPLRSSS